MEIQLAVTQTLLTLAVIVLSGTFAGWASKIVKLPDTVIFIIAGIIIGPLVFGLVNLNTTGLATMLIITFGAAFILYDGGREIEFHVLNKIKISLISLAIIGVLISASLTGLAASYLFGVDYKIGFLMGTILSPTDPSVLIPLFKKIKIDPKLKQLIIAESAMNDTTSAVLTIAAKTLVIGGNFSLMEGVGDFFYEALGGIGIGLVIGGIYALSIGHRMIGILKEFPAQVSLTAVLAGYSIATYFEMSGFMACFIIGVICGNLGMIKINKINLKVHEDRADSQTRFKEELTLMLRMMIFVLLGTHMDFSILLKNWWQVLGVTLFLIFVSRPVSVFFSVIWDRALKLSWKEIIYLMWIRETGVISAALASLMVASDVPHADIILAATFSTIVITLVLQSSTAPLLAKVLNLEVSNNKNQHDKSNH